MKNTNRSSRVYTYNILSPLDSAHTKGGGDKEPYTYLYIEIFFRPHEYAEGIIARVVMENICKTLAKLERHAAQ